MRRHTALFAVLFLATVVALIVGGTSDPGTVVIAALRALLVDALPALLWLLSAAGLGWITADLVISDPRARRPMRAPLGVALLLGVDQVAGSLGAFAGPMGAWALLAPGWLALMFVAVRVRQAATRDGFVPLRPTTEAMREGPRSMWPLAPALAVLLVAALSSPGYLWSTEFAGYDALSYHLALPRDWLEAGRLSPLEWNAYSYLPSWIEGATLHIFALGGDPAVLGIRAQFLHAMLALIACWTVVDAAVRMMSAHAQSDSPLASVSPHIVALLAAALFIGTPWIVVTGSMAYNEMGAALACAAMILVWSVERAPMRRGVLLGLFAAMAVGSKLSAAVLVLPPVVVLLLIAQPIQRRTLLLVVVLATITAMLALAPWLARNALATGNPLFPFASSLLGSGTWTPEQLVAWREAHGASGDFASRISALWNQLLRFGLGAAPDPLEPWRPFWSVTPWVGLLGAIALIATSATRRMGVALMAAFVTAAFAWILFTHMKSRFFIPVTPIAAVAGALGFAAVIARMPMRVRAGVLPTALATALSLVLCLQPFAALMSEGAEPMLMLGAERSMTGDELADAIAADPALTSRATLHRTRAFILNHDLAPLAAGDQQRVLLVGDAATFRYRVPIRWSTVWTRDPLVTALLRASAPNGAAPATERVHAMLKRERIGWVLVDPTMLGVWSRSGWLDPSITPDAIENLTATLTPLGRLPDGALLFRVPDSAPPLAPVLR